MRTPKEILLDINKARRELNDFEKEYAIAMDNKRLIKQFGDDAGCFSCRYHCAYQDRVQPENERCLKDKQYRSILLCDEYVKDCSLSDFLITFYPNEAGKRFSVLNALNKLFNIPNGENILDTKYENLHLFIIQMLKDIRKQVNLNE